MLEKARTNIVARAIYTYLLFLIHAFFSAAKQKVVKVTVFLSKLDHRQLSNYMYYVTTVVGGLVSV